MPLPETFIQHLRDAGYHPRSDKHSNALAAAIVQDLIERCEPIERNAREGRLVYQLNMDLRFGTSTWNVDLVLGTPPRPVGAAGVPIVKATPSTVQVAIEIKGVMTEHRKAVKNRKRDFEAHHDHVHRYNRHAIAGAVMVINSAPRFQSPLRPEVSLHPDPVHVVEHCLNEMRNVAERAGDGPGMDAKCAIVVDFDNIDWAAGKYLSIPPAPRAGDPLHYDSFLQRLCEEYRERFGR
ncbi:MAG TPA: hypothetical protein VFC53_06635 [Dehalococcoidia bacterium]|nr:hypothetical protein [Dehalococcoidia bacterium]